MTSPSALVAFNAHLLSSDATYRSAGISVYIDGLLRHLVPREDLGYHVFLGEGSLPEGVVLPASKSHLPTQRPIIRICWEQAILPVALRRLRAALYHGPAFVGPLMSRCPQVITLHDLSFLRHPDFFRRGNRLYLTWFTKLSVRRAAAIIAASQFTAREAVALLGISCDAVSVIYSGVAERFRPLPDASIAAFRRRKGLPDRFILYMGTLEPRKNLRSLVRAFGRLDEPDLHLVLAGAQGWFFEGILSEVARLSLEDRVHFPGFIPAEEQPFWYNAARAFSYVSTYEGFGLPVLEALACGVPTVSSSTTSLPEAGGDGVLHVAPDDENAIASGLSRVVNDTALRTQLRSAGLEHAARFTWQRTADATTAVYRRVLNGRTG